MKIQATLLKMGSDAPLKTGSDACLKMGNSSRRSVFVAQLVRALHSSPLVALFALLMALLSLPSTSHAQVYAPEGVNMPGEWNGWTNSNDASTMGAFRMTYRAFAGGQYVSEINISESGDAAAGTYAMLFTSGPSTNQYANKWAGGGSLTVNGQTSLLFNTGDNNQIAATQDGYYTFIYDDEGYTGSRVVVMRTFTTPVEIDSLSGIPEAPVPAGDSVQVTVYLDKAPSAEELIYIRYSTDFFQTSSQREVATFTSNPGGGVRGSVYLPAQPVNSIFELYALSTTIAAAEWGSVNVDLATLRFETNGGLNYKIYYETTVLPSNGARNVALRPELTWYSLPDDTLGYDLQVNGSRDFSSPLVDLSGQADTTYILSADLSPATTYYWRFKATGTSDWSNVYAFTTRPVFTYANVQFPPSMTLNEGNQGTFYGQVTLPGVTDIAGESTELSVAFGWNRQSAEQQTDPSGWSSGSWLAASYNEDKGAVGLRAAADEYLFELPDDIEPGEYAVAFRYIYQPTSDTVYGGIDGAWNASTNPSPKLKILDEPLQSSPQDGAQDLAPDTSLAWTVTDTTIQEFNLQISKTPDFSQIVVSALDIPASQISYAIPDSLERQTFYHWRVRSEYADTVSSWTGSRSFTIRPGLPDSVLLLTPANAEKDLPLPITLTWSSSALASGYEVYWSNSGSFASTPDSVTFDTTISLGSLSRAATYSWKVVPTNASGRAGSPVATFEVGIDGGEGPSLTLPADESAFDSTSVEFQWADVTGVDEWTLQIDTSSSFSSTVRVDTTVNASVRSLALEFARGLTYHWRIKGLDSKGETKWSSVRSLSIKLPLPLIPTPVSPEDGSDAVSMPVTLAWTPVDYASGYEVGIGFADSDGTTTGAFEQRQVSENRLVLNDLENDTTYLWSVRAFNATGSGEWSDTLSFATLVELPTAVELLNPADGGSDVPQPIALSWTSSPAASAYEVRFSDSADFTLFSDTTLADTTVLLNGLNPGELIHWKVRARNIAGVSGWSASRSIDVGVGGSEGPELLGPVDDAVLDADSVEFTWAALKGVESWDLKVEMLTVAGDSSVRVALVDTAGLDSRRFVLRVPDTVQAGEWIYWTVRGADSGGATQWAGERRLRKRMPAPGVVIPLAPADSASDVPFPVTLTWASIDFALSYEVRVSAFENLSAALELNGISDTSLALEDLATEQTYYWSVRAIGESGEGPWSDTLSFTTIMAAPSVPEILFPSLDARILPPARFAWNPVEGAENYEIHIASTSDFETLVDSARVAQITYTSDSLVVGQSYSWRVRAWNKAGSSEWSPALDFRVVASTSTQDDPNGPGSGTGSDGLPLSFDLLPNVPNPFNPSTLIRYDMARPGRVLIQILDLNGRLVQTLVDGWMMAGRHQAVFNGEGRPSGVYFVRMSTNDFSKVGRMTLLK